MSRRRAGGDNSVRGPSSALTSFLRDQGIDTRQVNTWRRREQLEEGMGEPEAGPSTVSATPGAGPSNSRAATSQNASGYNSDNLDEDESPAKKKKGGWKKPSAVNIEKEKAKAKAAASRKRKRGNDDDDDFEDDEEDEYTAPSRGAGGAAAAKPPPVGSFEACAECEKRFTVTKYTLPRNPPPGYLCHTCAKKSGGDPFKKPAPKRRKAPADKRKVVNFEETQAVKSLANMCIEIISKHIDDIDALGNISTVNMTNIAKIICKNRRLTSENVQLFYDAGNTNLTLTDATALNPAALETLASLNPNLKRLTLNMCGRITSPVLEHYAKQLAQLERIELYGPFLVRIEAWKHFFEATADRLQGFLITQSPRLDKDCLDVLVEASAATLQELRLCEIGLLRDDWLPSIAQFTELTYLDLSFPSESLSDEPMIDLLSQIGENLRHLDLSGHGALTDAVLTDGIAEHTKRLDVLKLSTLELLTDSGVAEFFEKMAGKPGLAIADLSRNSALADEALEALLSHSGGALTELSINSWKDLTNEALMGAAGALPQVGAIDVGFCREVDDFWVKAMLDKCPGLKEIKVYGCNKITENCPTKAGLKIFGVESHTVNRT